MIKTNREIESRDTQGTGYLLCYAEGSSYYIPGALHIEKDDTLDELENDYHASLTAKSDGIPLITNFDGVEDNVYVDTQENREIIKEVLSKNPEYYIC